MRNFANVSVIIACRNAEATLGAALDSVVGQTFPVREILLGDDASTDGTAALARSRGGDLPLRIIRSETNIGPASMRNRLLDAAQGEWIAILDGDDAWKPDRIQKLSAVGGDPDVVSDDIAYWDGCAVNGTLLRKRGIRLQGPSDIGLADMLYHDLGWLKPMIRTAFLRDRGLRYTEGIRQAEDLDLYVRILLEEAKWILLPDALYLYRRHSGSLSRSWRDGLEESRSVLAGLAGDTRIASNSRLHGLLDRLVRMKSDISQLRLAEDDLRLRRRLRLFRRVLRPSFGISLGRLGWIQFQRLFLGGLR